MEIRVPKSEVQCPRCLSTNSRIFLSLPKDPDVANEIVGIQCTQCNKVFKVSEEILPNAIQDWIFNKVFQGQSAPDTQSFQEVVGGTEIELANHLAKIMIVSQGFGVNFRDMMFLALAATEGGLDD